jgi:hypothetical protein
MENKLRFIQYKESDKMAVNLINSNDINITQSGSDISLNFTPNAVANKNVYSTSEIRIGTWIDGKPVYRKVIQFATGVAVDVDIDLTSLNIKRLVKIEGTSGEDTDTRPINFYYLGNEISTRYSGGHMYVYSSSAYGDKLSYLIIEYTKTTD